VRCPDADTFNVSKRLNDRFVAHGGQAGKINFAAQRMLRKVAYVTQLLPRKPGAPHLSDAQVLYALRRQLSACGLFQATINRGGGLGAQLLEDDGPRQHFKRGIAVGQLARPDPGNNRSKNDV